jgi:transcriptional antiterminator RfaH
MWYVLNTHSKKEFLAQAQCKNQGFITFLPTFSETVIKKNKPVNLIKPLFPSYLFVQFDPNTDHWSPLCNTIGIKKLISSNPIINKKEYGYIRPTPVPDHLIEQIQQQVLNPEKPEVTVIKPGLIVKVISGPMQQHTGICSWSDNKRVELLLNIMQGSVRVSFSREAVELV